MKEKLLINSISSSIIKELTADEIKQELVKWDKIYCPLSKKQKNDISYDQFKWHVFSYEKYTSLEGDKAISAYNEQSALEYYVVPQLNTWPEEIGFITGRLPSSELAKKKKDFYVYPKNMAWTMAFTHENGWLGPYFAKHVNYNKLAKNNTQAVHAKECGWQ